MNTSVMCKAGLLAAATSLLVACGGGSSGQDDGGAEVPPPAAGTVPERASRSESGLVAYLGELAASAPEAAEPLGLGEFLPPASEDSEPAEVD